jgi:DNA mismatch repair protein MutS
LFATHYHELTRLAELLPGRVGNLHVAVREWKDQVIFLHRIEPGRAEKSFGIHVARLAGLPGSTIARAKEILEQLSVDHSALTGGGGPAAGPDGGGLRVHVRGSAKGSGAERAGGGQMGLFAEVVPHPAVDALGEVELESLSPLEAFDALRRLKGLVQGGG